MHCDIRTETFGKFLGFRTPGCQFLSLRDGFVNPTPVREYTLLLPLGPTVLSDVFQEIAVKTTDASHF